MGVRGFYEVTVTDAAVDTSAAPVTLVSFKAKSGGIGKLHEIVLSGTFSTWDVRIAQATGGGTSPGDATVTPCDPGDQAKAGTYRYGPFSVEPTGLTQLWREIQSGNEWVWSARKPLVFTNATLLVVTIMTSNSSPAADVKVQATFEEEG
jgi:hypothetical protein